MFPLSSPHTSPPLGFHPKKRIMEYSYELYLRAVADSMGTGKQQKSNEADLSCLLQLTYQRYLNQWPNSVCLSQPNRYLLKSWRSSHSLCIPSNSPSENVTQISRSLHKQTSLNCPTFRFLLFYSKTSSLQLK